MLFRSLKHVRNWSYETLEREVRANLVYRSFCRIGLEKVPDAKTMVRLGLTIGPDVIAELHDRIVELAHLKGVTQGRKMRVDTTVVETNIHYPTDSTLLGDGTRVLTRMMKRAAVSKRGGLKTKVRDRMRSVKRRVLEIALAARQKGPQGEERKKAAYRRLVSLARKVVNQADRVRTEVETRRGKLKRLSEEMRTTIQRVRQVIRQTVARVFRGETHHPEKLVSIFEPHTEIIRKGKASKPTEFGKMIKIQEAERQIITHYAVYDERPSDSELLIPALEAHQRKDFDASVRLFKRIYYQFPKEPIGATSAYNVACGYALAGKKDEALDWLEIALAAGFRKIDHLRKDPDLDSLRQERRYRRLLTDR